jgi:p-aminobenzoyl-glutamate transporter AbgT
MLTIPEQFCLASGLLLIYQLIKMACRLPDRVLLPFVCFHALASTCHSDPFAILVVDPLVYLIFANHPFRPSVLARCYRNAMIIAIFALPYPYFIGWLIGALHFHALSIDVKNAIQVIDQLSNDKNKTTSKEE